MTKLRLPFMPLFVDDFLASQKVAAMTNAEIGAYCLLLMNCWASGDASLPSDEKALALMSRLGTGWKKSRDAILGCFEPHQKKEGWLTNGRLYLEWERSKEVHAKKSEAGRRSGQSRRTKREQNTNTVRTDVRTQREQVFEQEDEHSSNKEVNSVRTSPHTTDSPTENPPLAPKGDGGLFGSLPDGWHETPDPVGEAMEQLRAKWETCLGVAPRSLPVIPFKLERPLRQCIQEPGWLDAANTVLDMVRDGPVPLVGGKTIPLTINKFATDSGWVRAFADGSHKNLAQSSGAKSFPGDTYDPNDKSGF